MRRLIDGTGGETDVEEDEEDDRVRLIDCTGGATDVEDDDPVRVIDEPGGGDDEV